MMRSVFDLATRYPSKRKFPMVAGREKQQVRMSTVATLEKQLNHKDVSDQPETLAAVSQATPETMALEEMRSKGWSFTPSQWLQRFIFLESVAGVPGMVAATARHLRSLRRLERDGGWLHECLQDAENERMHLLSFLAISKPGWVMRSLLLVTQGVFYNGLFLLYLMSPRLVHRFVGILEEEAVKTYTCVLEDLQEGRLPEWEDLDAPEVAKEYWHLADDAPMVDLLRVVRADEAGHRFIHHSLANLESSDTNPFSVASPAPHMIGTKLSLERSESEEWVKRAAEELEKLKAAARAEKKAAQE